MKHSLAERRALPRALLGAWLAVLAGCGAGSSDPSGPARDGASTAGAAGSDPQRPTRTVVTAPAEEIVLRDEVRLSAEVVPWAAVTVAAEATGRVVEIHAEAGDRVAAGDLLVRIDDVDVRAQLARAEAQVAEYGAMLRQAERDLERGRQLAETQDISRGELDRLSLARDTTAAQLAAFRANVDLRESALRDTEVRAPFTGVVSSRSVEIGSWISPGSPLLRLVDPRRLKVRGSATQADRARLAIGMPARVTADALPGVTWEGAVRVLGQEADESTGTYLVEVGVDAPRAPGGERLLAGMQGAIDVAVGERPALVAPRAALVSTAEGAGFFVVDGAPPSEVPDATASVRFRRVEVGESAGSRLEILSGLEAGERVVVVGQHVLRDGDPINEESGP